MEMRMILLSAYKELGNGVASAVPVDLLEECVIQRHVTSKDFAYGLQAALRDGDFSLTSPGMIELTEAGSRHYTKALQLR